MSSQSFRPAQVALDGGIGVRASATVAFDEHQDYKIYGTASAPVRFWVNWRARNPGYQGGRLSLFSGYIVDNTFDVDNFQQRDYVIETFSHSEKGATITAKDALKLTSGDRAKAPRKSTGLLNGDISDVATSFNMLPSGVGDDEYPASGWIRLGDEIMSFTRTGDAMTVTRGEYNTLASAHSDNDIVQLCLYYNDTVTNIIYDLYTEYANVPTSQINKPQWDDEASAWLPGGFETLITEPVGVSDLVKELADSAPHYQYWDERDNFIKFVAIKAPPTTATTLTAESNLIAGSTVIKDQPDMRISTVIVRFGQYDPTKELDEVSNYRQAHLRLNPDAVTKYNDTEKYKTINSRWINDTNRAAALRLAARYGRRFEDIPRKISFSLDAKDAEIWTGTPVFINSDLVVRNEAPYDRYSMPAQVISAGENKAYQYEALEHTYGDARPEDLDSDDPNDRPIVLSGYLENINLRDIYDTNYPGDPPIDDYNIYVTFDNACVAGSTSTSASVDTGSWPELTTGKLRINVYGLVVGKGGDGSQFDGSDGGLALLLNTDIELSNTGIIGGGGGGGGGAVDGGSPRANGGGGAGYVNGLAGGADADNGTDTEGGAGGISGVEPAGDGGGLGDPGIAGNAGSGGAAGAAIDTNGYTITYLETGDIRGATL
jgi:hypothetical protein